MVGVAATPSGNSLTKTAGTGWGTGGAISVQELASGDGFVEVIASETTAYRLFGLSNGNVDSSIGDIDFAIYQYSDGRILIYESGNYRGEFATYAPGDRLRVAVEGGVVKYRKNGALLYTSLVAPTYPLLVDTSLYDSGSTIMSAVISNYVESVVWTDLTGVDAAPTPNSLTKTAVDGWGNGGAVSVQRIISGDCYVDVAASETTTAKMFGLSNGSSDHTLTDIDFGIYQYSTANLQVWEKGVFRGGFGSYAPGDRLRVAVENGVVKYRKNGALLYTSLVAPTYPLLVDTSLYTQGATIASAVISDLNSGKSLRNGLVHYWPFEESSGDRFDVVGGWTMSEVNGTLDTIAGKRILAPNFILTGNKHLNRASLVLPTTVTVACWYKVVSPHTVAVFLMATNTWPNLTQFAFYNLGTGALVNIVAVAGDGASITVANDTGALADGYHLLVAEYDASDKTTRLIIDGFVGPKSAALGGTLYRNAAPLNVGYHPSIGQTETPFDELMIWNRVLTPEEHAALYNGGVGRFYPF